MEVAKTNTRFMGKDLLHSIKRVQRIEIKYTCCKYLELSSWVPFQSLGQKGTWHAKYRCECALMAIDSCLPW